MADDDIIQKISLLGAEDIRKELNALGDEGAAALEKIEKAGGGDLAKGVRALIPEVQKFEKGLEGSAVAAAKLPGIFSRLGTAVKGLSNFSLGGTFAKDADAASAASSNLSRTIKGLGKDIRALGRVTDLAGLGQFGRSISLAGRNLALIAFPAAIAGLGGIANSAAAATSQILDLAAGVAQTPAAFSRAASVVIALGGSFEDAAKTIGKFESNIASAAASANSAAEAVVGARDALESTKDSFFDAGKAFEPLRLEQAKLITDLGRGKIASNDYNDAVQKLGIRLDETRERFNRAGDAVDKAQRALDKARSATTPLEDAFRKVGVTITDSFTKLPVDEQLKRIAPGFQALGKDVDKTKLAVQLFGEEMGRKFVDALSGGTAGLEAFMKEGERIRPALLAQSKVADQFEQTLGKLVQALASVKDAFGLAVAPPFIKFFNELIDLFVQNRAGITSFGQALATVLVPILDGTLIVIKGIIAAVQLLAPLFSTLASIFNNLFGSNLTGAQVFSAVILGIIGAFAGWIPIIILAATAISKLVTELSKINFGPILTSAQDIFRQMVTGFTVIGLTIVNAFNGSLAIVQEAWSGVVEFFTAIWTGIVTGAVAIWTIITDAFTTGADFIRNSFQSALDAVTSAFAAVLSYIQSWVQSGINYISGLIAKVRELVQAITGVNNVNANSSAGSQSAYAEGGPVRGPGTGTSDSIVARISNGEYVLKAAAVRAYGMRFINAINTLSLPRTMPGYSMGGFVDAVSPTRSIPRFAEGGAVTAAQRSAFTLQIGGEMFNGLSAPQDTADRMIKFATVRSIRKSGARPNWYGNGR